MKFVPKGPINNIPALVQIMAWRRPGDKPLSEPMMVILTTHICVTRPQWVNATDMNIYGQKVSIMIISFTAVTINWIVFNIEWYAFLSYYYKTYVFIPVCVTFV